MKSFVCRDSTRGNTYIKKGLKLSGNKGVRGDNADDLNVVNANFYEVLENMEIVFKSPINKRITTRNRETYVMEYKCYSIEISKSSNYYGVYCIKISIKRKGADKAFYTGVMKKDCNYYLRLLHSLNKKNVWKCKGV